jgi:hypothetical protein
VLIRKQTSIVDQNGCDGIRGPPWPAAHHGRARLRLEKPGGGDRRHPPSDSAFREKPPPSASAASPTHLLRETVGRDLGQDIVLIYSRIELKYESIMGLHMEDSNFVP